MTSTPDSPHTGWVNPNVKGYDPTKRKRCVNVAWRKGRRVRILTNEFGYGNKVADIMDVGVTYVYVQVRTGRKPADRDVIAYLPASLRLI